MTLEVTPLARRGAPIASAVVRPLRHGVQPALCETRTTVSFTLALEIELAA